MIDEPLALLAEAFGQDPEIPLPPPAGSEPSEDPSDLAIVAAAYIAQAEHTARTH